MHSALTEIEKGVDMNNAIICVICVQFAYILLRFFKCLENIQCILSYQKN